MVTMPTWLGAWRNKDRTGMYQRRLTKDPEKARFILQSLLRNLRNVLGSAAQNGSQPSAWCGYMSCQTYSKNAFEAKDEFVKQALHEFSPKTVLDIGSNTGHFSGLAARCGAEVIAVDSDTAVVGEVWRMASAKSLNILPLVVDITRPSPAMGWRNLECPSFLDRARGKFDAVLMLAVIHHMLVNERIPLFEIMDLASELTTDLLLIEFVAPEDPLFRQIARGRDSLFSSLTAEFFESSCRKHFTIVCSRQLSKTRQIYCMRKKS
jgi:SAM-dependent methyltransferase